jgi:hypothetical protein
VVIIINYVCSISYEVFCFLNFLHMICACSQIKLKYKFNTVISWQYYIICVKCYMKHFVKGGNHVSNDIRIWWALHVFVKYYDPRLSLHFWKWNKMHHIIFLHVFYFHLFNVLLKKVKNVDIFHEIDKKGYMSGCLSKPLTFFLPGNISLFF